MPMTEATVPQGALDYMYESMSQDEGQISIQEQVEGPTSPTLNMDAATRASQSNGYRQGKMNKRRSPS